MQLIPFLDWSMTLQNNKKERKRCHVCYSQEVEFITGYSSFSRVTSDCRPWTKGGKLGVCMSCGCVQKIIDRNFREDNRAIYGSYCVYHQSQGQEQKIFTQSDGESQFRSVLLLERVFERYNIPSKGNLLDLGCGNGNLLRSFSKLYPTWTLAGSELDDKNKQTVAQIKNVEAFYTCDIEEIPAQFDMITMLHSLEHIIDPVNFLRKLQPKLNIDGLLLIDVPYYKRNPFDLIIADHSSHFDIEILKRLLISVGFEILIATDDIIQTELTLLARKSANVAHNKSLKREDLNYQVATKNATQALCWLRQTIDQASKIAKRGKFGVFGTSIAGTWLYNELGKAVNFFVDEDSNRVGKVFMGHPVYHPKDLPGDWNVFIVLPFPVATDIWKRMKSYNARFYLPPNSE